MSRDEASANVSGEAKNIGASEHSKNYEELRLKLEKQKQDHFIALQDKNNELRAKDEEISNLRRERADKLELQKEVCDLNERLNNLSPLQRDYEASIKQIARLSAELDTIRHDREDYAEQSRRLKEQVDEHAHTIDNERRRSEVIHASLWGYAYEIQRLTVERDEWKEKFEEIKKRTETEHDINPKKKKGSFSYVVVCGDSDESGLQDNPSGSDESFKGQSNMKHVNPAKRPIQNDHYDQPRNDSGISLAPSGKDQLSPRKKRFFTAPCNIPSCKNCGTVFHHKELMATDCRFHRLPPQSYEVWIKIRNQETVRVNPRLKGHLFWPCCETHGRNRTKGCMVLRHHEIVYPDE